MIAQFNRFEVEMTLKVALECSHSGQCLNDVQYWAYHIPRSRRCTREALKAELKEYGAWDENELENDGDNWLRIVWIAAGNIREDNR